MKKLTILSILAVMLFAGTALASGVDNSLYAGVLERYVRDGLVDYAGLKADRKGLDEYLSKMGVVQPGRLDRDDRLAFYINLYNAATLQLIIEKYPVQSIKDIGSLFTTPWKIKFVLLEGRMVSLDYIEHDIIRPEFKEPRVHFALNCSAMSCPILLGEPYEGDLLDTQLQLAGEMFINDGKYNYLEGDTIYVSKIFDWFSEDFPSDFLGWFSGHAKGALRFRLEKLQSNGMSPRIKYLKYDWRLNQQ